MATLVRLRNGTTHDVLACGFGVDRSTITRRCAAAPPPPTSDSTPALLPLGSPARTAHTIASADSSDKPLPGPASSEPSPPPHVA
ncbi:transposase family protein [Streptomyces sp. NPDC017991]|uniref:transposase family protein n=1 Tax=Streptomyces sp. NPDC017991 TaxID=3365026 RepID=UPI00378E9939